MGNGEWGMEGTLRSEIARYGIATSTSDHSSMTIRDHRELRVWQHAVQLIVDVYRFTSQLPLEEGFHLTRQMRRAAVSIASNIAEGNGRSHRGDYLHFLSIAHGSLAELSTQLDIVQRLNYLPAVELVAVRES